ncbi:MAG TPA: histidine triad nucleotide-binding protein [Mycobacteriales bacterium]|nr:histidine triad nucleotide-binding protein [Mycobacteriales bacterium]
MSDCLFCGIVSGDVPADRVAENDAAVSFRDINPEAPTHVLVIPRAHLRNVAAVADAEPDTLVAMLRLAKEVAESEGIAGDGETQGYRLVANTGPYAHQTVFHAHLHLLGGRRMGWPPG